MKSNKSGFTLIELLVVIAVVVIIVTIVIANLTTSRQKGRDAQKVMNIKQIQNALQLYVTDNGNFPAILAQLAPPNSNYISKIPTDPYGNNYRYAAIGSGTSCGNYHLATAAGSDIEIQGSVILKGAKHIDGSGNTVCDGSQPDFDASTNSQIYDVAP